MYIAKPFLWKPEELVAIIRQLNLSYERKITYEGLKPTKELTEACPTVHGAVAMIRFFVEAKIHRESISRKRSFIRLFGFKGVKEKCFLYTYKVRAINQE